MLITAPEAAHVLGIEVQSVYNLVQRDRLSHHGPSHARRAYDLAEAEARCDECACVEGLVVRRDSRGLTACSVCRKGVNLRAGLRLV
jgi:hypothetical protein